LINDNIGKDIYLMVRPQILLYKQALTIDGTNGHVGIGDVTPDATLDVEGTVSIGSSGKVFSEIREITGTTTGANFTILDYPAGYTKANTRVLSCEILYDGSDWLSLGSYDTFSMMVAVEPTYIRLYYKYSSSLAGKSYRLMLMKVE